MKKYVIILLALVVTTGGVFAQNLITLQTAGVSSFYTNLADAVTNAQDGDTIYLPGGSFESITINKRLHLVGVGHHPDFTNATAMTILNGLSLGNGADNGSITGINFGYNSFGFLSNLNGYEISRCFIVYFWIDYNITNLSNISFRENILSEISFYNTNYIDFSFNNNIILGRATLSNSVIKNNIFLGYSDFIYPMTNTLNCILENNIFQSSGGNNNIYRNNARGGVNGTDSNGNQGSGNILENTPFETIFINYDAATHIGQSIYQANFHLPSNSAFKNAGRDGTDIGIYGGVFPWKEGSVPFNPHFQTIQISPKTDNNGNLNVNIKVEAQER